MHAHLLFRTIPESLTQSILDYLRDEEREMYKTALATLAASVWRPRSLITFGSPRVGNSEFCASLDGVDVQRFVDCCDIVTRVPPELKLYEHVGRLHYIDAAGKITENPDADEIHDDRMSARESYVMKYTFGRGNVAVRDLADHAPVNYVSAFSGRI